MTTHLNHPIVLVPGHWLGAWAWDQVASRLREAGFRTVALTLPGLDPQDPRRSGRTLDDQVDAIAAALRQADDACGVVLVAHSGANAPASMVLDRHPELVCHMVWVDTGPAAPGTLFAPDAPAEMPLPAFDVLAAQASLDGLDDDALARFRDLAVPQPGLVLRQPVTLSNAARQAVPTTLVCCSLPAAQVMELARAGHPMFAEVANLKHCDTVDLPTGHWPMWSRPDELASIIAAAATSQGTRKAR